MRPTISTPRSSSSRDQSLVDLGALATVGVDVLAPALDAVGLAMVVLDAAGVPVAANETALLAPGSQTHSDQQHVDLAWLGTAIRVPEGGFTAQGPAPVTIRVATEVALLRLDAALLPLSGDALALVFSWHERVHHDEVAADRARLHALLEHTTDIITLLEADGTVRYSNPAAGALTGFTGSDANGTSAFDLVHPDDQPAAVLALEEVLLRPTPFGPLELRMRFADDKWHPVEVFIDNLLDDPEVQGLVVTIRDVSERVRHEAEVRSRERWMRSLVDNLDDVVIVLDADMRVTFATPGIERLVDAPARTRTWGRRPSTTSTPTTGPVSRRRSSG